MKGEERKEVGKEETDSPLPPDFRLCPKKLIINYLFLTSRGEKK